MLASEIKRMMEANQKEYDELPVNKRKEQGAKNGWKGYTSRCTSRHSQSYSKAREELQQGKRLR